MELLFDKYHGIGNDFLVVKAARPDEISIDRVLSLCDRHYGVGSDGVLVITPARTPGARASMTVLNSDGSQPEMCGNGLRCVALHLCRQNEEPQASFVLDTDAGPLRCDVDNFGSVGSVGTEIGRGTSRGNLSHALQGETYNFERISTGNPHAICFRAPIEDALLDQLGPQVSGLIEGGANVEIATVQNPHEILVSVWERGVGRTLACGTGAAATVIAAVKAGHCPFDQPVRVILPGGSLEITVNAEFSAYLRGPAQFVYSGRTQI